MARSKNGQQVAGRERRVTLEDIAKVAGVHAMTVSDALKGTGRVSQATRERVHQIARELNYVPNMAARALATGRTGNVALLSGALNEPYYANIAHMVEAHLTRNGYKMLLLRTRSEVRDLALATQASSVDGAIAIDAYHLIDEFLTQGDGPIQPCVSIGTFSPPFVDHITVDLTSAVTEALQIMVAAGRKRIVYLVTSDYMASENEVRTRTYLAQMAAAGQEPEIINLMTGNIADVKDRFKNHLKTHGCPDGLLCQNDETAISAYRAILDLGYRIPQDVMLVGCDGLRYMEYFDPPISTIAQPMEEMCELAWKFLQQRINKPELPNSGHYARLPSPGARVIAKVGLFAL